MRIKTACAIALCFAASLAASEWTGVLGCGKCARKHADGSDASQNCIQSCVKSGASEPVLITEDKILKITADSKPKVIDHLGHKVVVTGTSQGDAIKVESVKMAD